MPPAAEAAAQLERPRSPARRHRPCARSVQPATADFTVRARPPARRRAVLDPVSRVQSPGACAAPS
ncbi:Hypothetical predicted protein, partial [Marmota monax]